MIGYCVKCKSKKEMNNITNAIAKNGRKMVKGNCSHCSTKMNVFTK